MTARQIDEAATRLRDLRTEAVANLGLAALAFGLALAASELLRPLALPLLVGGMAATALGLRAFLRRCFLLDDLSADRDAYAILDVRRHAAREALLRQRDSADEISVFPDGGDPARPAHSPPCEEAHTGARRPPTGA
jgi:hypothetical protein